MRDDALACPYLGMRHTRRMPSLSRGRLWWGALAIPSCASPRRSASEAAGAGLWAMWTVYMRRITEASQSVRKGLETIDDSSGGSYTNPIQNEPARVASLTQTDPPIRISFFGKRGRE